MRPPFRSIVTELAFLDMHQEKPLPDVIRLLFDQRVLQRHLWVAMRKLQYQRDYTFLIDANDTGCDCVRKMGRRSLDLGLGRR